MATITPSTSGKYRLVTRTDLNGLASLALMNMLGIIDEVKFAQPWDIESGRIPLSKRDITANLPYSEKVHLAFNYYTPGVIQRNQVIDYSAASTARVIYNHFGGADKLPGFPEALLRAVDRATLAQYQIEDVLHPHDWDLLNFILDPRTGIERYTQVKKTDEELIRDIAEKVGSHPIQEILDLPGVKERVAIYFEQEPRYKEQLNRRAEVIENLVAVDLRGEEKVYAGNRFIMYALYPHISLSVSIMRADDGQKIEFSVGKSIFNRTSTVHIGRLMEKYGGGGHPNAGTCTFDPEGAEEGKRELVSRLTSSRNWEWLA